MERIPRLAVFCDFENVALGARDAGYGSFDATLPLERLLDRGEVVVKRAYADWDRYRDATRPLHGANFELIEIPHVGISGKNSADIRMVVDALDLCFTKPHVDTFAIISGDSDFSPLVTKLRENDKQVVGVGVKASTSRLLVRCCDEFLYYDELVDPRGRRKSGGKHGHDPEADELDDPVGVVGEVAARLLQDREGPLWGSIVKQAVKRKLPEFSESALGFRNFSHVLEAAGDRGLLTLREPETGGGYVVSGLGPAV